jgi:pantoate--beta-alanine ligase
MIIFDKIETLKAEIAKQKSNNLSIGFVPTMGALHNGHLSLVDASVKECNKTVVSIFINPLQFNDKSDFEKYPRELDKDLLLLENKNVDYIFSPSYDEMYNNYSIKNFDLGHLNKILEGNHRPGHFNGVANVVHRLFSIVNPDKAFFGKKDYQQIYVIKKVVADSNMPITIVECPIIREDNGLAMSSRNERLPNLTRDKAFIISKILLFVRNNLKDKKVGEWKKYVLEEFNKEDLFELEYFEFVDLENFSLIKTFTGGKRLIACIAVYAGNVRLIDNININL